MTDEERKRLDGILQTTPAPLKAARDLRCSEQDLGRVVKEFAARRADTLQLLRTLPHAAWRRTGLHPTRGELTLEGLADFLARHDARHIGRIRAIR